MIRYAGDCGETVWLWAFVLITRRAGDKRGDHWSRTDLDKAVDTKVGADLRAAPGGRVGRVHDHDHGHDHVAPARAGGKGLRAPLPCGGRGDDSRLSTFDRAGAGKALDRAGGGGAPPAERPL